MRALYVGTRADGRKGGGGGEDDTRRRDIRSGFRVFEHRGGELFDAGHREGYSFVAASSRSYLVNQRGLADCYGVMKYRPWDVAVFLELEEKHEREGEGTPGENLNRGIS